MNAKRFAVLGIVFFSAFLMLIPSATLAGQIGPPGGGGSGSNTYYSLSGTASVSPTTVAEGQSVTLKLVVSSFSNDPTALFQVTSSSGTENVHSVTVTSDSTYSYTWTTNLAGSLGFRIQYISEVSSTGSITYSYIYGNSFTVNGVGPSISSVSGSPNPVGVYQTATFSASYSWGSESGQTSWSVNGAPGAWASGNQYVFTQSGSYKVTFTVQTGIGTATDSFTENVNSPSSPVTLTVNVYNGSGYLTLNHVKLYNGNSVTLNAGTSYSISYGGTSQYTYANQQETVTYAFFGWETNDGTLGSATSSSTTFQPENYVQSGGYLTMILKEQMAYYGTPTTNYAGFFQSGATTSAIGYFQVPTLSYVLGNNGNPETISIWVGIGSATTDLVWQAGLDVSINSAGSQSVQAFAEYVPNDGSTGPQYTHSFSANPGDLIEVELNIYNQLPYFNVQNLENAQSFNNLNGNPAWNATTPNFALFNAAQFIVEQPGYINDNVIPSFNTIRFSGLQSGSTTSITSPAAFFLSQTAYSPSQYATPTLTSSSSFDVTYSTTPP